MIELKCDRAILPDEARNLVLRECGNMFSTFERSKKIPLAWPVVFMLRAGVKESMNIKGGK